MAYEGATVVAPSLNYCRTAGSLALSASAQCAWPDQIQIQIQLQVQIRIQIQIQMQAGWCTWPGSCCASRQGIQCTAPCLPLQSSCHQILQIRTNTNTSANTNTTSNMNTSSLVHLAFPCKAVAVRFFKSKYKYKYKYI